MSNSPFAHLPMFGFDIIYADPPWSFDNWSEKGEDRNPNQHYDTIGWEEIAALPVGELASRNCACFLWAIGRSPDGASRPMCDSGRIVS